MAATTVGVVYFFLVLGLSSSFPHTLSDTESKLFDNQLIVNTKNGPVLGENGGKTVGKGDTVYRFRGIPFAQPPVGDLRFEQPKPVSNWDGVLDARNPGAICIQGTNPVIGSEDCLYLKVYTSKAPNAKNNLPVMVWIYGGAFYTGSPDFDDHSPDYLLDEGVIIVAVHYRVGILGFLSTGDTVAPGNWGLKDQILALKWIKDNIQNFGGDPSKITIFGQSAGASSVSYLVQTNLTQGLFSGAIMQSGSTLSIWGLSRDIKSYTKSVAKKLKVSTKTSQTIVTGLKAINVEDLQSAAASVYNQDILMNNPLASLPLGPALEPEHDGAVITGHSYELLKNGQFHQIPIMIGHTSLEALMPALSAILRLWLASYDLLPWRLVPASFNFNPLTSILVGTSIHTQYFGLKPISLSFVELMKFVHDDQWERPTQEAVRMYAKKNPVYYYEFSHMGTLYGTQNRTTEGVGHTEDLGYIFDFKNPGSEEDYQTRYRMVRMWANFAKYGNPTPQQDTLLQSIIWTPNQGEVNVIQQLNINNTLTLKSDPDSKNMKFWKGLITRRGNPPFDTY